MAVARHSTITLKDPVDGEDVVGSASKPQPPVKRSTSPRPRRDPAPEVDLEKARRPSVEQEEEEEIIIVDWKGSDDPACPLNWSYSRRLLSTVT